MIFQSLENRSVVTCMVTLYGCLFCFKFVFTSAHNWLSNIDYFSERRTDDGRTMRIRPEILEDVRVEDLVNEYLNSQENVRR